VLKNRLLFGAVLIAAVAAILYVDDRYAGPSTAQMPWRHEGLLVAFIVSILTVIATIEMNRLAEAAGHAPVQLWAAFSNYLIALSPYLAHNRLVGNAGTEYDFTLPLLLFAFFGACILVAARAKTERAISDIAVTLLIIVYAGLLPSFILRLRLDAGDHGVALLSYFLVVAKSCDIGAYFTGRAIGRHKLIEWLSPKKTVEGLMGGVALSIAVAIALSRWTALHVWRTGPESIGPIPLGVAALFGFVMAILGQGGDLLESLFKRDAHAKDSARLLPEFGGVLDMIDSLLPTAPIACLLLLQ